MKDINHAEGGIRTPKVLLPLDPEPNASANFATSAPINLGLSDMRYVIGKFLYLFTAQSIAFTTYLL